MKQTLLSASIFCVIASGAFAHQQTPAPASNGPTANQTVNTSAAATAAAAAAARAKATGGKSTATGGPSNAQASNAGNSLSYNGGNTNYSARGNNPDVILGSVSGGNPCGLGAGAGGSGFSLAAIFQMMWEGAGCQRNEDTKLLHNMGFSTAAIKNRLCDGSKYREAFKQSGEPCEADRAEVEAGWRQQGYRQVTRRDGVVIWVR